MESSVRGKINNMANVSDDILESLRKDIAEIKLALLGNEYNPTSGIVHRMTQVELENQKLRIRLDRIVAWSAGAAAALTIVANIVAFWFEKVILK
jgi:hypothetical protein